MVLTVSFGLSPVIGLSCHRRRCDAKHHHQLDASVEASGPHDFAVRLQHRRRRHHQRPPHPAPRFLTIASRPSMERDVAAIEMILSKAKAEYFSQEDWTLICPTGGLWLRPQPHPSFRGVTRQLKRQFCAGSTSPESITTTRSMDSGPAPSGASRNDGGYVEARRPITVPTADPQNTRSSCDRSWRDSIRASPRNSRCLLHKARPS
jgi:hypothetical protein